MARVFSSDDVCARQSLLSTRAQIAQISDRSRDDIEPAPRIAHYNSRLVCVAEPLDQASALLTTAGIVPASERRFNRCRMSDGPKDGPRDCAPVYEGSAARSR